MDRRMLERSGLVRLCCVAEIPIYRGTPDFELMIDLTSDI